jgi:hypothetical protein
MKKIAMSLIALAAISTEGFAAGNRNYELRDSDTYSGKYSTVQSAASSSTEAFRSINLNDISPLEAEKLINRPHVERAYF